MKSLILALITTSSISAMADLKPYLGTNTGLMNLKGTNSETTKSGYLLGVKTLASLDMATSVVDASLGYQMAEVSSDTVKITTKSLLAELEGRYKLSDSWSAGGSVKVDSGVDNTGAEYVGHSSTAAHLFAKAVYQTKWNKAPFRVEMGVGNSVNLPRNFTTVMVGVQFSLPESTSKITTVDSKDQASVKMQMAKVLFDTDSFSLTDVTEDRLTKLASYLKKTNSNWERVKISGHADVTGNDQYNKTLSQDRADAILKVLVKNGVSETKISSVGYGSKVPTNKDLARNRRIEIEFFGVKDRGQLNQAITKIIQGG